MDLGIRLALLGGALVLTLFSAVSANYVFPVEHKFKGKPRSLSALRAHDVRRHGRFLSVVDLQLGGSGLPSETGFVSYLFFNFCFCVYFKFRFWFFVSAGIDVIVQNLSI